MKTATWHTKYALCAFAGVMAMGVGVTGCNRDVADRTTVVTTEQPESVTAARTATDGTTYVEGQPPTNNVNAGPGGSDGTDIGIANAIERTIVENKQMTGSRIDVVVTAGVATLTGFVQNQQQKALAARAAQNTPGVVDIKNKIEIRPTGGVKPAATAPKTVTKTEKVYVPVPKVEIQKEKETVYVPVPTPARDSDKERDRSTSDADAMEPTTSSGTRTETETRSRTTTTTPRTGTSGSATDTGSGF